MAMLEYYYLSLLVFLFKFVEAIVLFFVPRSWKRKLIAHQMGGWGIHVTVGKETAGKYDKNAYQCEMIVHDERTFDHIMTEYDLGVGESYMKGWWDSDDLVKLQECQARARLTTWDTPMLFLCLKRDLAWNQQLQEKNCRRVIDAHYDLGNDLYEKMLDPGMNYSCGIWRKDTQTLTEAQKNKMDLVARKLKLKPGMKVLDLGTGWGSMAKYLAKNYKVSVVGYTLSQKQMEFGKESCKGLDVEFRLDDYRNATGVYDRVYSIEFFEHVGHNNYRDYFSVVRRCLKDDGIHLCQCITMRDRGWPRSDRWIMKYIFPGGELPYPDDFLTASEGLLVLEDMQNIGSNYYPTLKAWEENFDAAWKKDKLEEKYGGMVDGQFYRMWKLYLACSMGWYNANTLANYHVVQSKNGLTGGYLPEI